MNKDATPPYKSHIYAESATPPQMQPTATDVAEATDRHVIALYVAYATYATIATEAK